MSIRASDWAWEQPLKGNRKLVLLALAAQVNGVTGICFPGQEALAAMCRMSERALQGHLSALVVEGYIERSRRHRRDGTRTSDSYTLGLPADSRKDYPQSLRVGEGDYPQIHVEATRRFVQTLPADSAGALKEELEVKREPEEEPEVKTPMSELRSDVVEPFRLDVDVSSRTRAEVNELFAYWQQQCGHPHAKLTPERRDRLMGRLKQGYSTDQIRTAINGAAKGAWTSETGKRFDDLELICRNGTKLESFIDRATTTTTTIPRSNGRRESPSDLLRELMT